MAVPTVVTVRYYHPDRAVAILRAYICNTRSLIHVRVGQKWSQELSLGPVEFTTDFGDWTSATKLHGGWNFCSQTVWFAFNCKGAQGTLWKFVFRPDPHGPRGCYIGEHPYNIGVGVTAVFQSIRFMLSTCQSKYYYAECYTPVAIVLVFAISLRKV